MRERLSDYSSGGHFMQHIRLIKDSNERLWALLFIGGQFWPPDGTKGQKPRGCQNVTPVMVKGFHEGKVSLKPKNI